MLEEYFERVEQEIKQMRETAKRLRSVVDDIHNEINKLTVDDDALYYVDENGVVYDDEDKLKEDHIDDYEGLDDEMTDWYPESEEITGLELKQMIERDKSLWLKW